MPKFQFGSFVLDSGNAELVGPDGIRDVEPQVFGVLQYLVEQHGRLVTKEELLDNVWGDRFVSESALTTRIKQARRSVDDDGTAQWAIKTVHGRGYRFIPEVAIAQEQPEQGPDAESSSLPQLALPEELQADARQLFCGRAGELEQAAEVLDAVTGSTTSPTGASGAGFGWVWILGEPGIGKTRLAAEVAGLARDRGHRVLFGRNGEDLRVPYQPFIEVLRELTDPATEAALAGGLAPLRSDAAAATDRGLLEAPTDSTIDNETRRFRMFEAVADWLIELSSDAPVVMVIDDVQWAADSTFQLLSHLQRRQGSGAVTFVLTSRDTAPDINPRVSDLIATGTGRPATTVLRLEGLSDEEAVRLVGEDVDVDEVMRQTAGNPLFLQTVNDGDGLVDMPSTVRRRLARLDEGIQETLRIASVMGLEFELEVAAATTERDALDLLDDLEFAVAARLLDDVGHDRFRFTHALVRSSLRGELSSSRQARIHRRISLAFEQAFGEDPRHLPALAFHTAKAAAVDRKLRPHAIELLRRAAAESSAQFSFEEAAELIAQARDLADPADTALAAQLALEQGIAEARSGKSMTAARTFDTAIERGRETNDPALQVEAALRYEDAIWRPGVQGVQALGRVTDAAEILDRAIADGSSIDGELALRARLAVARVRALVMSGQMTEVDEAFADARRLVAELGSPTMEAGVLGVYVAQVMFDRSVDHVEPMVQRLAELEPMIDDGDLELHAVYVRLQHAARTGRFDQWKYLLQAMADLQNRSGSRFWAFVRANQEAMEAFYRGDLDAAERLAEHCLELADELPEEDGSGTFGLRMFLIRREQDRLAAMAPMVRHVMATANANTGGGGFWTPGLALLLIETGAADEAAEALAPARASGFDLPVDSIWSTVMVLFVEAMVQLGDVEACRMLRAGFENQAGANVTTGSGLICFGRAERYLGMLSFVIGDYDEAERYLGIALEGDSSGGSVLWSNESRLWMSRVRRAQGHEAEADAMLEVVAREAKAADLNRLLRLATEEGPGS